MVAYSVSQCLLANCDDMRAANKSYDPVRPNLLRHHPISQDNLSRQRVLASWSVVDGRISVTRTRLFTYARGTSQGANNSESHLAPNCSAALLSSCACRAPGPNHLDRLIETRRPARLGLGLAEGRGQKCEWLQDKHAISCVVHTIVYSLFLSPSLLVATRSLPQADDRA